MKKMTLGSGVLIASLVAFSGSAFAASGAVNQDQWSINGGSHDQEAYGWGLGQYQGFNGALLQSQLGNDVIGLDQVQGTANVSGQSQGLYGLLASQNQSFASETEQVQYATGGYSYWGGVVPFGNQSQLNENIGLQEQYGSGSLFEQNQGNTNVTGQTQAGAGKRISQYQGASNLSGQGQSAVGALILQNQSAGQYTSQASEAFGSRIDQYQASNNITDQYQESVGALTNQYQGSDIVKDQYQFAGGKGISQSQTSDVTVIQRQSITSD